MIPEPKYDGNSIYADAVFVGCGALKTLTIAASIEKICDGALNDDNLGSNIQLGTIDFETGSKLKEIGEEAFKGRTIKNLTIPKSVTKIGENAFANCNPLEKVYYTGSVAEWCSFEFETGANPLENNMGNTSYPVLYVMGSTDFERPKGDIDLSDTTITKIPSGTFREITYNNYNSPVVETEEDNNLTSIVLPSTVTEIGDYAFSGCRKLKVTLLSTTPPTLGEHVFEYYDKGENGWVININDAIYVPAESYVAYKNHTDWKYTYAYKVETLLTKEEVRKLRENSSDYETTKKIVIPCEKDSYDEYTGIIYTRIAGDAFSQLTDLKEIEIPETISLIYAGAFKECRDLNSVTFSRGGFLQFSYDNDTPNADINDNAKNAKLLNGDTKFTFTDSNSQEVEVNLTEYDLIPSA